MGPAPAGTLQYSVMSEEGKQVDINMSHYTRLRWSPEKISQPLTRLLFLGDAADSCSTRLTALCGETSAEFNLIGALFVLKASLVKYVECSEQNSFLWGLPFETF